MLDNLQASAHVWGWGSPHLPSSLCRSYPLFLAPRGLTPKMLVTTLLRRSGEGVPRTARRVLPGPTVHPAGTWPCPSSGSPAGSWAEYRAASLAPLPPTGNGLVGTAAPGARDTSHLPQGQNVALQGQAAAFPSCLLALPLLWR